MKKNISYENLIIGLRLIAWGLFKKVVIADRLAIYVNIVYQDPTHYHWLNLLIATVLFAVQIYCDFSGYSDMALGIAKVMGFDLMINFNRPYFATNIKEFWDRWHISLSSWFRDYVYIPLGGNKKGFFRQLCNVTVIFVISGIWHGANNTFVIWGILHAGYTVVYMLFNKFAGNKAWRKKWLWNFTSWFITMVLVCFAWIFFRASSLAQSWDIIKNILHRTAPVPFEAVLVDPVTQNGFGVMSLLIIVTTLIYMFFIEKLYKPKLLEFNAQPWKDVSFLTITTALIILLGVFVKESFIYFQF